MFSWVQSFWRHAPSACESSAVVADSKATESCTLPSPQPTTLAVEQTLAPQAMLKCNAEAQWWPALPKGIKSADAAWGDVHAELMAKVPDARASKTICKRAKCFLEAVESAAGSEKKKYHAAVVFEYLMEHRAWVRQRTAFAASVRQKLIDLHCGSETRMCCEQYMNVLFGATIAEMVANRFVADCLFVEQRAECKETEVNSNQRLE